MDPTAAVGAPADNSVVASERHQIDDMQRRAAPVSATRFDFGVSNDESTHQHTNTPANLRTCAGGFTRSRGGAESCSPRRNHGAGHRSSPSTTPRNSLGSAVMPPGGTAAS